MEEILERIETWAGSRIKAEAWYRSHPITSLDGLTAEQLVDQGRTEDLKEYLDHIENGGFA